MKETWADDCAYLEEFYLEPHVYRVIKELRDTKDELILALTEIAGLKNELSKCAWHGAFEEYEEDNRKLREEIERLKRKIEDLEYELKEEYPE